ncbi:S8/S53 family peptidase [Phototrophicus methaneseepsis]|uniref:S8/S53 family peptidase n=1 Tax=Phototrophicus methaneseepsis TaxID=2710758 RepID=A0A7S8E6J6_9CHLR|nr:S8/S53 family peptidase [Phototrophicus methaneseepsis]QPC81296.1 S8/S53 family peptidase [Phototrophicus methaneseepsis]
MMSSPIQALTAPGLKVRFDPSLVDASMIVAGVSRHLADQNIAVLNEAIIIDQVAGLIFFPFEDAPSPEPPEPDAPVPDPPPADFSAVRRLPDVLPQTETSNAVPSFEMLIPRPGSAPGPSTTGGPGTTPQAVGECDKDIRFVANDLVLVNDAGESLQPIAGRTVNVFVLDTSPFDMNHDVQLRHRLNDFEGISGVFPFVQRFLSETIADPSPIPIEEVAFVDMGSRAPTPVQSISNHGIFIASIIKTIAPEANVTIIPVMSRVGVGSIFTVADVLNELAQDKALQGSQVLVNLSANARLMFGVDDITELTQKVLQELGMAEGRNAPVVSDFIRDQLIEMNGIPDNVRNTVANFAAEDRRLIVAAGNDWTSTIIPPWPKFPAYMKGVVGVGAVRSDGMRTDYSNLPQIPQIAAIQESLDRLDIVTDNGIYAYGGTANAGLLGLFINDFINLENGKQIDNTCGIAQWAGTSFATAVVTGYMAWLCLRGLTAAEANTKLKTDLPQIDGAAARSCAATCSVEFMRQAVRAGESIR